jgi:hypothetical protein
MSLQLLTASGGPPDTTTTLSRFAPYGTLSLSIASPPAPALSTYVWATVEQIRVEVDVTYV